MSIHKDTTFTKLFVGGLPYHTTDQSLKEYFQQYGDIEEAVVITDRQTGKSRGYGFVTMSDRATAELICKEPNPIIDGRKANVNLAYLGAKPRLNATDLLAAAFPFALRGGYGFPAYIGAPHMAAGTIPQFIYCTGTNTNSALLAAASAGLSYPFSATAAASQFPAAGITAVQPSLNHMQQPAAASPYIDFQSTNSYAASPALHTVASAPGTPSLQQLASAAAAGDQAAVQQQCPMYSSLSAAIAAAAAAGGSSNLVGSGGGFLGPNDGGPGSYLGTGLEQVYLSTGGQSPAGSGYLMNQYSVNPAGLGFAQISRYQQQH